LTKQKEELEILNGEIIGIVLVLKELKDKINKKNVEIGLDKKLVEMKYLRMQLSNLMKIIEDAIPENIETKDLTSIIEFGLLSEV
jgi:hypothetical protein